MLECYIICPRHTRNQPSQFGKNACAIFGCHAQATYFTIATGRLEGCCCPSHGHIRFQNEGIYTDKCDKSNDDTSVSATAKREMCGLFSAGGELAFSVLPYRCGASGPQFRSGFLVYITQKLVRKKPVLVASWGQQCDKFRGIIPSECFPNTGI